MKLLSKEETAELETMRRDNEHYIGRLKVLDKLVSSLSKEAVALREENERLLKTQQCIICNSFGKPS